MCPLVTVFAQSVIHDVECRAALTLFHIIGNILGKNANSTNNVDKDGKKQKRKKKKNQTADSNKSNSKISFELISELGTQRQVRPPPAALVKTARCEQQSG